MKLLSIFILVLLTSTYVLALPEAQVTAKVVDETGRPIQNVKVSFTFNMYQEENTYQGMTDTNGLFSAQGETGPHIHILAEKEGYYHSTRNYYMVSNEDRTRYDPWGGVQSLTLRKIIDLKDGKTGGAGKFDHRIKENWSLFGQQVGFDYVVGDWVKPHGEGIVSDFLVTATYNEDKKFYAYSVHFTGKGNGISELPITNVVTDCWSEFSWPHKAPLDGYVNIVKKKSTSSGGDSSELFDFDEIPRKEHSKMNHIFRIRTQYDEDGNITSAYYGKMKGYMRIHPRSGLRFSYWLNTDPESRSLESTYKYRPY